MGVRVEERTEGSGSLLMLSDLKERLQIAGSKGEGCDLSRGCCEPMRSSLVDVELSVGPLDDVLARSSSDAVKGQEDVTLGRPDVLT
jgi:hypothetical protein